MQRVQQKTSVTGNGLYSLPDGSVATYDVEELTCQDRQGLDIFLDQIQREFPGENALASGGVEEAIAHYFDPQYMNLPQTFDGYNRDTGQAVDVKSSKHVWSDSEIQNALNSPFPTLKGVSGKQAAAIDYLQAQKTNVYFLKIFKDSTGNYRCLKYFDKSSRPARGKHRQTVYQMTSAATEYGLYAATQRRTGRRPVPHKTKGKWKPYPKSQSNSRPRRR